MKNINKLIQEDRFFKNENITIESLTGLSIGYILELANLPDFTSKNYNPDSKQKIKHYINEIQIALISKPTKDYFKLIYNELPEKFFQSYEEFTNTMSNNFENSTIKLYDAFGFLISGENNQFKLNSLYLSEIKMFSRIPSDFKGSIIHNLQQINNSYLNKKNKEFYDLANRQFTETVS